MSRRTLKATPLVKQLDRDLRRVEEKSVASARRISFRIVQKALRRYPDVDMRELSEELRDLLGDAMYVTYLMGIQRSIKQLTLSEFDETIKILERTLNISDVDRAQELFETDAFRILNGVTQKTELELRKTVNDLVIGGVNKKEAQTILRKKFESLGLTPNNDYQLETIFRTQSQIAYQAGRYASYQDPDLNEIIWGYKYVTAGDNRVRTSHEKLDGIVLPKDDPFWDRFWPPNGWSCRCQVIPVFDAPPGRRKSVSADIQPDRGFDYNPGKVFVPNPQGPLTPLDEADNTNTDIDRKIAAVKKGRPFKKLTPEEKKEVRRLNREKRNVANPPKKDVSDIDIQIASIKAGRPYRLLTDIEKKEIRRLNRLKKQGTAPTPTPTPTPRPTLAPDIRTDIEKKIDEIKRGRPFRLLTDIEKREVRRLNKLRKQGVKTETSTTTTPTPVITPTPVTTTTTPNPLSDLDPRGTSVEFKTLEQAEKHFSAVHGMRIRFDPTEPKKKALKRLQTYSDELHRMHNEFQIFERTRENSHSRVLTMKTRDKRIHGTYHHGHGHHDNRKIAMSSRMPNRKPAKPRVGKGEWAAHSESQDSTWRHEYGHAVWYEDMTATERFEFTRLAEKYVHELPRTGKNNREKYPISQYAAKNEREIWAEAFSAYTNPYYERGSLPPEIEEFFDLVVKKKDDPRTPMQTA